MNYFNSYPVLTDLILPYTIRYAREKNIKNIQDVEAISYVCQDWFNWVYHQQKGPFRALKDKIKANFVPLYQGKIDHFNSLLKVPNLWFDFVQECIELSKNSKNSDPLSLSQKFEAKVSSKLKAIDPNIRDALGKRPIITAIQASLNNIDMLPLIDILIRYGANPNAWIYHQYYGKEIKILPLWFVWLSKSENCQRVANALIQQGASINLTCGDENDHLLLYKLKNRGPHINLAFIRWFKEKGGNLEQIDKKGKTAFDYASYSNSNLEACCALIELGVKMETSNGNFLSHIAQDYVRDENLPFITFLLEKAREDVYALDQEGYTPLYWAVKTGKLRLIELLTPYFKERQDACEHLLLSALTIFLKKDIVGNWFGQNHMFSFIDGYHFEHLENHYLPLVDKISSFLTRNGEKDYPRLWLKEVDDQGNTFLHILARDAPYILTEIIRRQSLNSDLLQLKNKENRTIQMLIDKALNTFDLVKACFHIDIKAAKRLIDQEVDLNLQDENGNSLLHVIIDRAELVNISYFKDALLIIDLLLNAGINPNHQNKKGNTPLHEAIFSRYYHNHEIMIKLCDKGADVALKNSEGKSPLDLVGASWPSAKKTLQKAWERRLSKNV